MIVIICALLGCVIGGSTAKRRGGQRLDILQYAAGYAIAFSIVGVLITVAIDKAVT